MNEEAVARAIAEVLTFSQVYGVLSQRDRDRLAAAHTTLAAALSAMPAQGWRDGVEAAAMIEAIKDGLNGWIGITDLDGAAASIASAIRALTPPETK